MPSEKEPVSKTDAANTDAPVKPAPRTTNTTDPQDHMKGPISSLMQGIDKTAEEEGGKTGDSDE